MPRITITIDIDDEYADPAHDMGVTNDAYDMLLAMLAPYGDDITFKAGDDD